MKAKHIDELFGTEGQKMIWIPKLIDDYNHKMGGVDLVDQHIAYYQPNVQCQRNWIPLLVQVMGIIRKIHMWFTENILIESV